MASGFITLPDGTDWHSRWTGYDLVLETIAGKLNNDGDEGHVKKWLSFILPNEDEGDIESCYCFYKKTGDEHESVLRILDTRLMKDKYREIFWSCVAMLKDELNAEAVGAGYLIHSLHNEYIESLKNEYKSPPLSDDDKDIFLIGGFEIRNP